MALIDMFEVRGVMTHKVDDERTLRSDPLSVRHNVIEGAARELPTDTPALPLRIHLGVGEDHPVVDQGVRREANQLAVDVRFVTVRGMVVSHHHVERGRIW